MNLRKHRARILRGLPGFSLVEVSLVLIVFGLILGGVFKGKSLLSNAKVHNIINQINEYRAAVNLFQEQFQALPGDYSQAKTQIDPNLQNGNDNGVIDGNGLDTESEAFHFWSHLSAAGFIALPQHNKNGASHFGNGVPTTALGGGITVVSNPETGMPGHWFVIGSKNDKKGNGGLLTPQQAYKIDQSLDTGDPTQGDVITKEGGNGSTCLQNGQYNLKSQVPSCVVYVKF